MMTKMQMKKRTDDVVFMDDMVPQTHMLRLIR